jgi:hypothetical protein
MLQFVINTGDTKGVTLFVVYLTEEQAVALLLRLHNNKVVQI